MIIKDTKMPTIACPCGSDLLYEKCCGQYHAHDNAPTAEALMRSRYSAFCLGKIDYVAKTMKDKACIGFDAEKTLAWTSSVYWLGLKVIEVLENQYEPNTAYVEFIARFMHHDAIQYIHECSEFKRTAHKWFYVGGTTPSNIHSPKSRKIAKNALCPCNSLKKFKNCHGL